MTINFKIRTASLTAYKASNTLKNKSRTILQVFAPNEIKNDTCMINEPNLVVFYKRAGAVRLQDSGINFIGTDKHRRRQESPSPGPPPELFRP